MWEAPPGVDAVGAEAVVEVRQPPAVARLYFWALQVSFQDRGRLTGGAHLGLQWGLDSSLTAAVNFGGYHQRSHGGELDGTESPLPDRWHNPNTRAYPWVPNREYLLRVVAAGPGEWAGQVVDLHDGQDVTVRRLFAAGDRVVAPIVWSEVFARCDDPPAAVRWSRLALLDRDGARRPVSTARVNYQRYEDGGCTNTASRPDRDGFLQLTNTERDVAQDTRLTIG